MNPRQKFPESFRPIVISKTPRNQANDPELGGLSSTTEGRLAKLFIWGDIGGWWGVYGADVYASLKGQTFDKIEVYISSGGGSVFEAFEIYDLLKGHPARVEVFIFSLAASAATIVASAGDRISISRQAIFMIHYGALPLWGYYQAKEIVKEAQILSKFDNRIIDLAVRTNRVGLVEAELRDLYDEETWFEPEEALAAGFVDEVIDHVEVPFDEAQTSRSDFEDYFYHHTAEGTIKAAKTYNFSKIAASSLLPLRLQKATNKRIEAQGQTSPTSNNFKMNFGQQVAAWAEKIGIKLQNKAGEVLSEEQVAELANKADNGAPELIAKELRSQITALVKETVAEVTPEPEGAISEDKIADLMAPIAERLEALESQLEKAPQAQDSVDATKSRLDEISARLQSVASRRSGGQRPNDPQNLNLGKDADPEKTTKAFGVGSQVYNILVTSGKLNASDVLDLEAKAAKMRKESGKTA